jgi:hypothetical protein
MTFFQTHKNSLMKKFLFLSAVVGIYALIDEFIIKNKDRRQW